MCTANYYYYISYVYAQHAAIIINIPHKATFVYIILFLYLLQKTALKYGMVML